MTAVATNPFTAAASAVGYLYQCRYAFFLLLQRSRTDPTAQIAVEKFDDISFEVNGTPNELIQTKHRLGRAPDLTDGSPDLWKTLRVWSDALFNAQIAVPATTLTIVTSATCGTGSAAELLRPAPAPRDPDRAHVLLVAAAARMTGETLKPAKEAFLRLSETQRKAMLKAVVVVDRAPNIAGVEEKLREALGFPVHREHMAAFQQRLEGWWFTQVIRRLSGATSEPITGFALHAEMDDLREQFRLDALTVDFRGINPSDLRDDDDRTFVQQLRLINFGAKRIRWAQIDYFRAFAQRSKWVTDNLVEHAHLERYDRELVEEWEREFDSRNDVRDGDGGADGAVRRGVDLFQHFHNNCRPIRPNCTEAYIGRGSYQLLADRLAVGWHPDFRRLLDPAGAVAGTTTTTATAPGGET